MKKVLLTGVLTTVVAAASFYAQIKTFVAPARTMDKDISLNVSAGNAYRSRTYADCDAVLHVTFVKESGNENTTLLDVEYPALALRKFPLLTRTFNQTVHVPDVADSREQIVVRYTVTYTSKENKVL